MAKQHESIDDVEDFDDGTRAVTTYDERDHSDGFAGDEDVNARMSSSRKSRLQSGKHSKAPAQRASKLRVQNWDAGLMESAEYAGKVVQRKEIANEDEEDQAMDSPDEDAMADWSDAEPFGASGSEGEAEEAEEAEDTDDEEEEEEDRDAEELIRDLEKEDSAQLMSATDTAKQVEKARHVHHQKIIWERCLEVQIYTKRLLTTTKDATATKELMDANKKAVIEQLYSCIDAVSSLQDQLCNTSELSAPNRSVDTKKRKRTCDDAWREITEANEAVLPQYNDILNVSTRKTNLAGGNQTKKFKTVNQDILAQVESVLADTQRVKRKAHAPLDVDSDHTSTEEGTNNENMLDELMYDDSDFYQQLLKEFIESGGGGAHEGLVRRTHRKKKNVNRKASKGRVIRYTVHPKLENFMFPEPYPKSDMDADELFRSLFGQARQN